VPATSRRTKGAEARHIPAGGVAGRFFGLRQHRRGTTALYLSAAFGTPSLQPGTSTMRLNTEREKSATMTWTERLQNYAHKSGFPQGLSLGADGRVFGMWIMGNDYRVIDSALIILNKSREPSSPQI
jgi:hypothetical protein